jgi:hypothetical protein
MDEPTEVSQHPGWTFNFDLTVEELIQFNRAACRNMRAGLVQFILLIASSYFSGIIVTRLGFGSAEAMKGFLFYVVLTVVVYIFTAKLYARVYYRNMWPEGSPALAERRMIITAEGVTVEQEFSSGITRWPAITQIVPDEQAVYLMISSNTGYTIPYRVLPPEVVPAEFLRVLRSFKECARV